MSRNLIVLLMCVVFGANAQKAISVSVEAEVTGGKAALEQVLQTQLTLPKLILTKNFDQEIILYFELDSVERPKKITFNKGMNNLVASELKRLLLFLKFNRKTSARETPYEYFLTFHLSTEKFNKYTKQRTKPFVKSDKPADSSYIINTRADKSPEYFKKGDEGLTEFLMAEIQYPEIAKQKSIQGTVVLQFVIETNGFVTNLSVKEGVSGGCTEEALRLLKQTKWQPAVANGKMVRYQLTYPVTFNLQNNFKDNSSPYQSGGY